MMSKGDFKISQPTFNALLYLFCATSIRTGQFSPLLESNSSDVFKLYITFYPRKYQEVTNSDFWPVQFLMAFSHKEHRCFLYKTIEYVIDFSIKA